MIEFIRRNSPVFTIGFVTIALFVGLIYLAQKNTSVGPSLEKLTGEELISEHTYTLGSETAKVVLVEFSDFQCPACKQIYPVVKDLLSDYPNDIYFGYRHFPLPQHTNSKAAAIASQVAGREGKFWEYAGILFSNPDKMEREDLIGYAVNLGIDRAKFEQGLDDPAFEKEVSDDTALGIRISVNATPTFILNNKTLQFSSFEDFRSKIIAEIKKNNPSADDDKEITALINTDETTQSTGTQNYSEYLLDQKYGVIQIEYTKDGFVPSNVKAVQNQLIVWTNKTDKSIELEQLIKLYPEFNQPVIIAPNGTFELRMTQEKLWNFKEKSKRHYGSIFVVQP
ncbi:hypothetical protein A2415_04975 [candidate division WWE3 bacterium RIFOXYC1_FULL_39_7]|uniref:Thioredoxin domain-containing protein n=2 Tax=Katanobacteria TaxID=422282 RepID=A0A1F4X5E2_UNCKA|nr:MAG: hypothetical protein A2415_04975 [candidate division WWE3 bacterium RIFOXYC1_FULL_39_7]OGC76892.1 MAG: hypothetical protein A2619_02505 [candidate division WWE3 bacterium RIFOXYD1_FULL_39_9]